MSLAAVVDHVAARLRSALAPGTTVGDAGVEDALPAVTLSLSDVVSRAAGVGRVPRGTRSGALEVGAEVDLADPVLDLGSGETLPLVSADRRSLVLPHGPLVRADGTVDQPFTAGDLQVRDSAPYAVVGTVPSGREVRPDVDAGVLRFGQPLSATGTLQVTYRIGAWDVVVSRYQGRLDVRTTAERTDLPQLTRRVAEALEAPDAAVRLLPLSWGSTARATAAGLPPAARQQDLGYAFDAELEQPLLGSGGGVIARVEVRLRPDPGTSPLVERFDVT